MKDAMICSRINGGELARQADVARALGSQFVAQVLEAAERQLHNAPVTSRVIATWPGDPARDAMAMRLNAALHAMARRGTVPALSALYAAQDGDFDGPIAMALAADDEAIAAWMLRAPQTNEVGRAAAIAAALMVATEEYDLPFELLELGSSAGLNLNLGRYAFDLGGVAAGELGSAVHISPVWTGNTIRPATINIVRARGVDLNPLDAADEDACDRLLSYVWADQLDRAERLAHAVAIARAYPPIVDRGDAGSWSERQLAAPQDQGVCRVVFHSMVLQYLDADSGARVDHAIETAGARADTGRPLIRIGYEWNAARTEVVLGMTCWPGGHGRDLARCHAYAAWIDWRAA